MLRIRGCQRHEISNGLLLRSDLHRLFDEGYMTLNPGDRRIVVSKCIREEFENGKDYYKLEGPGTESSIGAADERTCR
jgi:putative restriction endonuclease